MHTHRLLDSHDLDLHGSPRGWGYKRMAPPLAKLVKQTGEKEIQSGIPDQKLQEAEISPSYATSVVV